MKNRLKRTLAILVAVATTLTVIGVSAAENGYSEDFQNRTVYQESADGWGIDVNNGVSGIVSGSNDILVDGELKTSSQFGGIWWGSRYEITKERLNGNGWGDETLSDENNVLKISSNGGEIAVMNVVKKFGDFENGFVFSADVKNYFNGSVPPVSGIRLAKESDETSYYELAMLGKDTYEKGTTRFVKNTGASASDITSSDDSVFEYVNHGGEIENALHEKNNFMMKWFKFEISVVRNIVSYKIVDKSENETVYAGIFTDTENMLKDGFIPQMVATGSNNSVYYDNISVSEISNTSEKGIEDNFETYSVGTSASGKSAVLAENAWISSANYGDGAVYSIEKDEKLCNNWDGDNNTQLSNKVLSLNGGANKLAVINSAATVENGAYTLKADVRNYLLDGQINTVNGIRLAQKNDETKYYEIALTADESTWKGTEARFTKVVGGDTDTAADETSSAVVVSKKSSSSLNSGHGDVSGWNGTHWYTAQLTVKNKKVSWKITDKESGATAWEGEFNDTENFLGDGVTAQLFAYGGSKAFFDNVSFAPVAETKKTLALFDDDFESRALYEETGNGLGADYDAHVPGIATGSGYTMFESEWQTSAMYGGNGWASDYRIQYEKKYANGWNSSDPNTENKVIAISPADQNHAAINMVKNLSGAKNGFVFTADVRNYFNGTLNESTGIRLVDKNNEANYYELALRLDATATKNFAGGVSGVAKTPRFTKVSGADKHTTAINTSDDKFDYVAYGDKISECELVGYADAVGTNQFRLSIAVCGKKVQWSVKNLTTDSTDWQGAYEFENAINAEQLVPQLYTYSSQSGAKAYFDNVKIIKNGIALNKITSSVMTIDTEILNASADSKIIIAYYDENNVLINAQALDISTDYEKKTAVIPNGAVTAKAFAIESLDSLAPLTEADICDF